MSVAHIGFSLIILGITASSIWQDEKILNMKIDDRTKIKNYTINFNKIKQINGPNFIGFEGNFIVSNEKNKFIANLKPQNRLYLASNNTTTEVSIHTNLLRDLYLVLGDGNPNDGWVVRIYHNPLVIWIWIGTIIVIIGGIIALKNNIIRLKNKKE
tara:strand:- start:186 stop:653 length:468 start_codon:yes stop_codon:yes gene_type:complete